MSFLIRNAACFFVGSLLFSSLALSQWSQTAGPYGGRALTFLAKGDSVFVGTEGGGIFFSTNTGRTWVRSDPGVSLKQVNILTAAGGQIFAGTNIGVLRSDDNGASWMVANGNLPDSSVHVVGGIGGYVLAGFTGYGICRSSDGGQIWDPIESSVLIEPLRSMLTTDSLVFLGTATGCFLSTDSGLTWVARSNGMQTGTVVRSFVAVDDTVIMAGTRGTIYRSGNFGETWVEAGEGIDQSGVLALEVNGDNLFAGTDAGVYQSINDGGFWSPVDNGMGTVRVNALVVSGSSLLSGTDEGVFRTVNNGAFWEESNDGLASSRVRGLVSKFPFVFAGTRGNGIFRTINDGQTWQPVNDGLTNLKVSCLVNSEEFILAGTLGGGVFRSDDNGSSWETVTSNPQDTVVSALLVSGNTVYAGTDLGVCVSGDNGDTWDCGRIDTAVVKALAVSGSLIFAGSVGDGMFRSTDNGETWNVVDPLHTTDTTVTALAVFGQYIFAGTFSKGIFRSADNGDTWQPVNVGMGDTLIQCIMTTDDRIFIGTYGQGAFTSTDNGDSWTPWNENLQKKEILSFLLVESTIYGGTNGWSVESRPIPPEIPDAVFPGDNAVDIPIPSDLSWTSAIGATSYDVEVCLSGVFDTLVVDEPGVLVTTLPLEELANNTTYHWRVRGNGPGGQGIFSPASRFSTVAMREFMGEVIHSFPETPSASTDYRLISVPGIPSVSFSEVLPGVHEVDWSAYEDTGVESADHLIGMHPDSLFAPGKGYWAIARGVLGFSDTVQMPSLGTDGIYRIHLQDGWNIIGNPFDRPVEAADIGAVNGDATLTFWSYNGIDQFDTTTALRPFEGYYFKNPGGWTELKIPYPFPASNFHVPPESPVDWKLQVVLETIGGNDRLNFVGIAPEALQGKDRLDRGKPPAFGSGPHLTFVGVDGNDELLSSDFRPELGDGQVWYFDVVNPQPGDATLRFPRDAAFPTGLQVLLVNADANNLVDVMADSVYSYQSSRETMRFMLIVGGDDFVKETLESGIPEEFALSQNFPNPFNPETALSVGLPHGSDIRLSVYSILGEEIDVLASGVHAPGRYTFVWRGVNNAGNQVASGVYFARLVVDGKPMFLRKMMLLR